MTLSDLREVANISKIFIYNEEKNEDYESQEYSVYGVLCKYGYCKVIRVYAELELSNKSNFDNSIGIKPIVSVVIKDKE